MATDTVELGDPEAGEMPAPEPIPAEDADLVPGVEYQRDDTGAVIRNKDGSPRRRAGRPTGGGGGAKRTRRKTAKAPRAQKPAGATAGAKRKRTRGEYREGIAGLLQMVAVPLTMAGAAGNPTSLADGAAVAMHAPAIADAVGDLAIDNPAVAAVLDRVMAAGPYAALIGAVTPLAIQLAANHRVVPPQLAEQLGAEHPDHLVARIVDQAAAEQAATNGQGVAA